VARVENGQLQARLNLNCSYQQCPVPLGEFTIQLCCVL
jgi:hypothetical protein